MDKSVLKSKTMWGFGLAALIGVAQIFGVTYTDAAVTQVVQIITMLFGGYGLRDAASN